MLNRKYSANNKNIHPSTMKTTVNYPVLPPRYSPTKLRFLHALACAVALALTAQVASAQTWTGATTGFANTSNLNTWNLATNWTSPATIPNAAGSTATFSNLTGALTVYADTAAATNITIGTLNLNSNQDLLLGMRDANPQPTDPTDLGSFTFDGNGQAAVVNVGTGVSSNRGIYLASKKTGGFALSSNLTVNLNVGPNTGRVFGVRSTLTPAVLGSAALNGNGNTITLNGGRLAFLGNGSSLRNVTVDLRNADKLAFDIGSSSNHLETNVTYQIGKVGGQDVSIGGSLTVAAKWELSGNVEFFGASNRGFTNSGFIADASGTNTVTYGNAALTSGFGSVTLSGTVANTYSGGTLVRLTANTTVLNANKAGAFGTGLLTLNTGNVKLGADQTIGGLAGLTGSSVTGSGTTQRVLEINSASNASYAGALGNIGANENNLRLVKNGIGIQTLTGANTYIGTTTVTAGTLLLNTSHTGGAAYSVSGTGTLGGNGTIIATSLATAAGSKLAPGSASGLAGNLTLTLSGGANISASSNDSGAYVFDLAAPGASDRITLTLGTLDIGTMANADFVFSELTGFAQGTYILFNAASAITGSVTSALNSISFTGGLTGTLSLDSINNDVLLTVVPEPTTWVLLAFSMTTVMLLRRRKRA